MTLLARVPAVNRAARAALKKAANVSLKAGKMSATVLQSLGAAKSTIDSFKAAFPTGSAPLSAGILSQFSISPTALAGKFMTASNMRSFAEDRAQQLKSLSGQVGKARMMSYSSMKGQALAKAQSAKSAISSSLMSKIGI